MSILRPHFPKGVGLVVLLGRLVLPSPAQGSVPETVSVSAGELRPTWLAPIIGKKNGPVTVRIPALRVMPYAVTRTQFAAFLKAHPQWTREQVSSLFADADYLTDFESTSAQSQAPVTQVSWFAARAYCESTGMRLPTVDEWEYLAAASETKRDATTEPAFLQRILDWYGKPKEGQLPAVGTTFRNVYGLWDLHGLIWEWVEDFNSTFVTGESREDSSFNKNMFCGSGSLTAADRSNYASFMRFALRSSLTGRSAVWNLGFRCVHNQRK